MDNDTLNVKFFGGFLMRRTSGGKECVINDRSSSSKKLWPFLQYLIIFRHKEHIPQSEIIDMLWDDDEDNDPVNALKTLLHRARALVETLGYQNGKQVILYRRGGYRWNPDFPVRVDTEEFETLCSATDDISSLMRAVEYYEGDFLPKVLDMPWALSLRSYYHAKYIQACYDACDLLESQSRFADIADICNKAVLVAPYEEELYMRLVRALSASGDRQNAVRIYTYAADFFMDRLGVKLSDEFTALYREISIKTQSTELDINIIRDKLKEPAPDPGPYFCELAIFQEIYRREARATDRTGTMVQLALLTLLDDQKKPYTTKQMSAAMERLRGAVISVLRQGDAFTRFSPTQYLLLLACATREGGEIVYNRIASRYRRAQQKPPILLQCSILPLQPVARDSAEGEAESVQGPRFTPTTARI